MTRFITLVNPGANGSGGAPPTKTQVEDSWAQAIKEKDGEGSGRRPLTILMSDRELDDVRMQHWCTWFEAQYCKRVATSERLVVKEANFAKNRLTGVGVQHLLRLFMKHQVAVGILKLWNNLIDQGSLIAEYVLGCGGSLRELHLSHNRLDIAAAEAIILAAITAVDKNKELCYPRGGTSPLWLRLENNHRIRSSELQGILKPTLERMGRPVNKTICCVSGKTLCNPRVCNECAKAPAVHLTYVELPRARWEQEASNASSHHRPSGNTWEARGSTWEAGGRTWEAKGSTWEPKGSLWVSKSTTNSGESGRGAKEAAPSAWSTGKEAPSAWSTGKEAPSTWSTGKEAPSAWSNGKEAPSAWSTGKEAPSAWSNGKEAPSAWSTGKEAAPQQGRAMPPKAAAAAARQAAKPSPEPKTGGPSPKADWASLGRWRQAAAPPATESAGGKPDDHFPPLPARAKPKEGLLPLPPPAEAPPPMLPPPPPPPPVKELRGVPPFSAGADEGLVRQSTKACHGEDTAPALPEAASGSPAEEDSSVNHADPAPAALESSDDVAAAEAAGEPNTSEERPALRPKVAICDYEAEASGYLSVRKGDHVNTWGTAPEPGQPGNHWATYVFAQLAGATCEREDGWLPEEALWERYESVGRYWLHDPRSGAWFWEDEFLAKNLSVF